MNLALIGYGQMSRIVEEIALSRGHKVCVTVDPVNPEAMYKTLTADVVAESDVCIEFTLPAAVLKNIKILASAEKSMVIGTTGWYDQIDYVRGWLAESKCGLVYAPNFSLGVNLFYKILEQAAQIMNKFDTYDVAGLEYHHRKKADSPSGTAKKISEILLNNLSRKKKAVFDLADRRLDSHELHFASIRCGAIPGTHKVLFDSEADSIEFIHTARNRRGFALGSVLAAEWILNKEGIFTVDDFIQELLNRGDRNND
jgi:4-hydroxy-tetrahydrodipicolinate reductase